MARTKALPTTKDDQCTSKAKIVTRKSEKDSKRGADIRHMATVGRWVINRRQWGLVIFVRLGSMKKTYVMVQAVLRRPALHVCSMFDAGMPVLSEHIQYAFVARSALVRRQHCTTIFCLK